MTLSDAYIKFKIIFHIPLPLKNFYFRGRRITTRKNWFCKSCLKSFDLVPWKSYKNRKMSEVVCPYCGSKSIHWSDKLFRAMVDGEPTSVILNIANNPEI
jgi:DNA-directed RNA polymerase subunit RPC12/RpoP